MGVDQMSGGELYRWAVEQAVLGDLVDLGDHVNDEDPAAATTTREGHRVFVDVDLVLGAATKIVGFVEDGETPDRYIAAVVEGDHDTDELILAVSVHGDEARLDLRALEDVLGRLGASWSFEEVKSWPTVVRDAGRLVEHAAAVAAVVDGPTCPGCGTAAVGPDVLIFERPNGDRTAVGEREHWHRSCAEADAPPGYGAPPRRSPAEELDGVAESAAAFSGSVRGAAEPFPARNALAPGERAVGPPIEPVDPMVPVLADDEPHRG